MHDKPPHNPPRQSGFRSLVAYSTAAWQDGYAEVEVALGPQHMNSVGITHGGVYATLLDAAFGQCATWCSKPGNVRHCVTITLTTTFLDPAHEGTIRAIGRLEEVVERIAFCRGEIVDRDGRVLAIGQGSFRYRPGSERVEGVPRDR